MKNRFYGDVPAHWLCPPISDISEINPKLDKSEVDDELMVSFVPMPAVQAETGVIDVSANRPFKEVKKGYTAFRERDVLFAKITPCMENGKMAVVPELVNDVGFGSTEFHVIRALDGIAPRYLYYFVSAKAFRFDAEHNMTGAVGQRRVPTSYLTAHRIPLPPSDEQHRIVTKIEALFSELEKGVESLNTAREQLKVYRQAVLKHALEGKRTARWRQENRDKLESSEILLSRIQEERQARYQEQLRDWQIALKLWEANGKAGKKPTKPSKPVYIKVSELSELPTLPSGWIWLEYGGLCERVRNGISVKPEGEDGDKIFRISAVRPMDFALDDVRYIDNSDHRFDDYRLKYGDLVFTRYNGSRAYVGVCAEYDGDGSHLFPDKLIQTRLGVASIHPSYLEKALNCGESRRFVEQRIRTTAGQSGVSGSDVKAIPVPICSLDEQHQIVKFLAAELSRSDKMMEEIEFSLIKSEALRQSVLKKAFSGRLVSQDPNDEPAAVLLERLRAEKARQQKPGKASRRVRRV